MKNMKKIDPATKGLLEKAPIPKAVASLALPTMVGMLVAMLYNVADTFFIGQLDDAGLVSAVTITLPIFTVFMALGNIFGVGGGNSISRLLGSGEFGDARRTASFSFYGCIVTGTILAAVCLVFIDPILKRIGASVDTLDAASTYTRIIALGGPLVVLSFAMGQLVRAEGAAKVSMKGMVIGTLANLLLDPLLILKLDMGVAGAAVATLAGNGLSVLYYGWYFVKKSGQLGLSFRDFTLDPKIAKNVFSIGLPAFVNNMLMLVSLVFWNVLASRYGDTFVAIFGIASKANMLPKFLVMGLCQGIQPLIGYSYASGNDARMDGVLKFAGVCGAAICVSAGVLLLTACESVVGVFLDNAEIVALGVPLVRITLLSTFFYWIVFLFTGFFQATGRSLPALTMSLSQALIFIPALFIGDALGGLSGIAYALPVADCGTALMATSLYLYAKFDARKKRLRKETLANGETAAAGAAV